MFSNTRSLRCSLNASISVHADFSKTEFKWKEQTSPIYVTLSRGTSIQDSFRAKQVKYTGYTDSIKYLELSSRHSS
jgi:hypothetical protein